MKKLFKSYWPLVKIITGILCFAAIVYICAAHPFLNVDYYSPRRVAFSWVIILACFILGFVSIAYAFPKKNKQAKED